jgi:hypothetical protein
MMSYFLPLPLRLLLLFRLRFLVPPTEDFAEENIPVNLDFQLSKRPGSSGLFEENIPVNGQLSKKPGFFAGVGAPGIGVGAPWIGATGVD